jgi:hypothetical protein
MKQEFDKKMIKATTIEQPEDEGRLMQRGTQGDGKDSRNGQRKQSGCTVADRSKVPSLL